MAQRRGAGRAHAAMEEPYSGCRAAWALLARCLIRFCIELLPCVGLVVCMLWLILALRSGPGRGRMGHWSERTRRAGKVQRQSDYRILFLTCQRDGDLDMRL